MGFLQAAINFVTTEQRIDLLEKNCLLTKKDEVESLVKSYSALTPHPSFVVSIQAKLNLKLILRASQNIPATAITLNAICTMKIH